MKQLKITCLLLGFFCLSQLSHASAYPPTQTAAGFVLGEPTAFTGKYWLDPGNAIDAQLGYSFGKYFVLYGDYLWHFDPDFLGDSEFVKQMVVYLGAGGGFRFSTQAEGKRKADDDGSVEFFARVPAGAEWFPSQTPLGVYFEVAPGFRLVPGLRGLLNVGLGARYYF